jgi:hypothetical protein
MHPIRNIKEKVGSAVEDIAITAPQLVKDVVVTIGDKVKDLNEKVLEPEEQRFAEEHGYTHGGTGEKIVKYLIGVDKYEAGAHFINEHFVNPMRSNHDKDDPAGPTPT